MSYFQFLQSYNKMSLKKVHRYVLRVKSMQLWSHSDSWGSICRQGDAKLCILHDQARRSQATYFKTHFSDSSPPQCQSQAVVCVSTPAKRVSKYIQTINKLLWNPFIIVKCMICLSVCMQWLWISTSYLLYIFD